MLPLIFSFFVGIGNIANLVGFEEQYLSDTLISVDAGRQRGGVGNFQGPIVGALVLIAIPEILKFMHIPDPIAANARLLVYGLLLIIMTHVRPQGLAGEYRFK